MHKMYYMIEYNVGQYKQQLYRNTCLCIYCIKAYSLYVVGNYTKAALAVAVALLRLTLPIKGYVHTCQIGSAMCVCVCA